MDTLRVMKPRSDTPYVEDSEYAARTHELTKQQAALQLVRSMRVQIAHSRFCRHVGNRTSDMLNLHLQWTTGMEPLTGVTSAVAHALIRLPLDERAKVIRQLLAPYVSAGDIPEFDLVVVYQEYAADYLRIDFPYPR